MSKPKHRPGACHGCRRVRPRREVNLGTGVILQLCSDCELRATLALRESGAPHAHGRRRAG